MILNLPRDTLLVLKGGFSANRHSVFDLLATSRIA